jgi:hypothetical protein
MTDSLQSVGSRQFSRWHKAAALAPALLLLVYLPAQLMLRCRFDGLLREACCCPQKGGGDGDRESQSSGPAVTVKAQDCCDREVAQPLRLKAEAAGSATRAGAPVAAVVALAMVVPPWGPASDRFNRAAQRHGPVREGPRIVLLKQAFLI